jgi:hypothetical protein
MEAEAAMIKSRERNDMKKTMTAVLAATLFLAACGQKEFIPSVPDSSIISGFTTGVVSASSPIVFRFAYDIAASADINVPVKDGLFSFDPGIDGVTAWSDTKTLEFRPGAKLKSGQKYLCRLNLGKVLKNEAAGVFRFIVNVIEQNFELNLDSLKVVDQRQTKNLVLPGTLQTADNARSEDVEKILSATQEGQKLAIAWTHGETDHKHAFTVSGITRRDTASEIVVAYNGQSIGANKEGKTSVTVPSVSNFEILGITPVKDQEQYIEIAFSDPLKTNQDLRGLVTVVGQTSLRFQIDANFIRVYNLNTWPADANVTVNPGIANSLGLPLKIGKTENVVFQLLEPRVRFLGKGTILPTTNGLTLPIETCNLNAVTVEAIHIYDDNMDQFFQVNRYDETAEIHRVGRPVWKQTVSLNWDATKRNRWVRSGLDLTELTRKNPKGLYRLKIYFTRANATRSMSSFPNRKTGTPPTTTTVNRPRSRATGIITKRAASTSMIITTSAPIPAIRPTTIPITTTTFLFRVMSSFPTSA